MSTDIIVIGVAALLAIAWLGWAGSRSRKRDNGGTSGDSGGDSCASDGGGGGDGGGGCD